MHVLTSIWQYFHDHYQDNLIAGILQSTLTLTIAWFWKIKPHILHLHRRIDNLHEKLDNDSVNH